MRTSQFLAAVVGTAASLLSQRILVVDSRNGPGTNFTDLPAAEAAAVDGDILRVDASGGPYTAIQTSKALTICGTGPQAMIRVTAANPMRVSGLGANKVLALKELLLLHFGSASPGLQVQNCLGHVTVDNVEIDGGQPGLDISLATLTMKEGRLLPASPFLPTVVAQAATLSFVGVAIAGSPADIRFAFQAQPALQLNACTANFIDCNLRGGNGDQTLPPGPGMRADFSAVELGISGGNGAQCLVMAGAPRTTIGAPAIVGQSSQVRATSGVQLLPSGSSPQVQGVSLAIAAFPTLGCFGVHYVYLFPRSLPGAAELTLYGFAGRPFASTAFAGLAWFDPGTIVAQIGAPPFSLPGLPYGMTLVVQLANLANQGVVLSNPAVITAR